MGSDVCVHCCTVTEHYWENFIHCLPSGIYKQGKDHPKPILLQAKESQLSQPFLIEGRFQSFHLYGPSLNCLWCVRVSLALGSSELDTALPNESHQGWAEGKVYLPRPAGNTFPVYSWILEVLFCYKSALKAHV